ncbi:TPA: hypothetical protein U1265_000789 [Streptococcus suis]|nr:hypothetical protein [Streptococcus suis]HEM5098223.1 hypothetical protein [Streptococcus suis]HEM5100195.1 hypothetical protein [Streptococcus suis]HEM5101686.1 hypothetical protein [Streptococcus suis]HEM5109708.1 hypothetical protein [Streptococcus suis]
MSLVNIANDWVFRKSWSSVLNFEIDKWVTDEALALLEYQIPKNAFGKSVRSGVLKNGIGVYLRHLSESEANEQGFTDIMLKVQKSRPKELKGLKPDFKISGVDGYVINEMLFCRWIEDKKSFWFVVDIDAENVREFAIKLHKLFLNGAYLEGVYVGFSKEATTKLAYEIALELRKYGRLEFMGYNGNIFKGL